MSAFLRSSLCLILLSVPSFAADFYVDVVHGNDANAGTSPATAWRTLTYASAVAPSGPTTTLHVAPGVYDAASGEVFPLHFHLQRVVGDQGSSVTILDGGGGSGLFEMLSPRGSGSPTSASEVRGFTLRNAMTAVFVASSWSTLAPILGDLQITGMGQAGIIGGGYGSPQGPGSVQLTLDHVRISGAPEALGLGTGYGTASVTASDCSFNACTGAGVSLLSFTDVQATFTRCRFEHNAGAGVLCDAGNYGIVNVHFVDCLLAHDAEGFQAAPSSGLGVAVGADFERCTVADNTVAGVRAIGSDAQHVYAAVSLRSTLVQGNAIEVDASHLLSTDYSQIGGPDPLFVDRANGDYRLSFGSPCIDVGDPATPRGVLDLAGNARPIDGDLDTHERADIGAFEHAPLFLVTSGHLGAPLALQLWGPSGGTTTVYFSRLAPVAPMSTPFGEFDLDPIVHGTLFTANLGPNPPFVFHRPIPNNPLLVGRTFSFQALTSSSAAPQGFAYTNAVAVTITP